MACISFVFYKEYYYFLFFWILDFIASMIKYKYANFYSEYNGNNTNLNNYMKLAIISLSDLLSGFLVLITYYRSKPERQEEQKDIKFDNKLNFELIYTEFSESETPFFLIILSSLLDLLGNSANFLYYLFLKKKEYLEDNETLWILSIDILSRIFFSRIILKNKLHSHHILSTIIFVLGFLPIAIFEIPRMDNFVIRILFLFPRNIIFALDDILTKIIFTYKFILPQYYIFYRGIICILINIIIFIILYFTHSFDDELSYFDNKIGLKILYNIGYVIVKFIRRFCIIQVIYIFSPLHVTFLNIIVTLTDFLISLFCKIFNFKILEIVLYILPLSIIVFGTLIFNEIIIIKFCNLDRNTKPLILDREEKEKNINVFHENTSNNGDGDKDNDDAITNDDF